MEIDRRLVATGIVGGLVLPGALAVSVLPGMGAAAEPAPVTSETSAIAEPGTDPEPSATPVEDPRLASPEGEAHDQDGGHQDGDHQGEDDQGESTVGGGFDVGLGGRHPAPRPETTGSGTTSSGTPSTDAPTATPTTGTPTATPTTGTPTATPSTATPTTEPTPTTAPTSTASVTPTTAPAPTETAAPSATSDAEPSSAATRNSHRPARSVAPEREPDRPRSAEPTSAEATPVVRISADERADASPSALAAGSSSNGSDGTEEAHSVDPAAQQQRETGPLVTFLDSFTNEQGSPVSQMRQVLVGALGVGFLTAAGFVTATWHGRHGAAGSRGPRAQSLDAQDPDQDL